MLVFSGLFTTKNEEDAKYFPERKLKRDLISNALPAKVHLCISSEKTVSVNLMDKKYFSGP